MRVRFANGYLNDPIERVARDPIRKLSRSERLIGTALSCLDFGDLSRCDTSSGPLCLTL